MRKIFSYTLGLLLTATGCSKFLDHPNPVDVTDDKWWNIEANAKSALNVIYVSIDNGTLDNGKQLSFFSALSDESVVRTDYKGEYELGSKGQQQADWSVAEKYWRANFEGIRRVNRFLEHVDRCVMDANLKTRYKYEARAVRAYLYMELLELFGGVPLEKKSLEISESSQPPASADEVYNFVITELTETGNNLPKNYTNAEAWRITSGACWAMISRLALYNKKYDIALDAAKKVIAQNVYSLYKSTNPANSYTDLFNYNGELNNERILFKQNGAVDAWVTFAPQGVGGITALSPTAAIVNAYETLQGKTITELGADSLAIYQQDPNFHNNRDPRLKASVLLPGTTYMDYLLNPFDLAPSNIDKIGTQNSTATGFWQNKYLDVLDRNGEHSLDFMIIRYAEILLNYAEAQLELGQGLTDPKVIQYLNDIRSRAGMPAVDGTVYNSPAKLKTLIHRERQVELAFEGVRYLDIRRWGILGDVMNGVVAGAVAPDTHTPVTVETRSINPVRDLLWPVPKAEILANPNAKQNPLYN